MLVEVELTEPRLERAESPLDRQEGTSQSLAQSVAAHEPASRRHGASDEQEGKGSDQDDAEPEGRQHSGQQEPDSGEGENAPAQLLGVG